MSFLRAIHLRGFKTFARPCDLVFEPGVTVIIGPNGSGKSNVADAVLWALGEQSPTAIRGRSMQDVIFAGSDGRRPAAAAEVSLIFDNRTGAFPLEYDEVQITRRVERDGSSEYRINGGLCRLADVMELIAGVGLGREMHTIISQGKVEEFLNSTPLTRRALVEEAAGLGRFKKRRQRSQNKLERVRDNLARVADVEREARNALRPLKAQASAAERHTEVTEELGAAQARLALFDLVQLRERMAAEEIRVADIAAKKRAAEQGLDDLRTRRGLEEERFAAALREREAVTGAYHRVTSDVERLRERAGELRQRAGRAESELARVVRRRELAESEHAAAAARMREIDEAPAHHAGRLDRVLGFQEVLQGRYDELLPLLEAARADEDALKERVFELEAARSRTTQERDVLRRDLEERERRRVEAGRQEEAAAQRLEGVLHDLEAVQGEASGVEARAAEAASAAVKARADVGVARVRADESRARLVAVSEALEALTSRARVLEGVLARREGVPAAARQVLQRVSGAQLAIELLRVRPGHERAIIAALGPLAHAVVLTGRGDGGAEALHGTEGPIELLWTGEGPGGVGTEDAGDRAVDPGQRPTAGMRDLWEVVEGPQALVDVLRPLIPATWVAAELPRRGTGGRTRVVSLAGEMATGETHLARRTDPGADQLLSARGELETIAHDRAQCRAEAAAAAANAGEFAQAAAEAEAALLGYEEGALGAERAAARLRDEAELVARRIDEAKSAVAEVVARRARESAQDETLRQDMHDVTTRGGVYEREAESARADLRLLIDDAETRRRDLARVEQKRSQAALLAVKLRERRRVQEEAGARVRLQLDATRRSLSRARSREEALASLLPELRRLVDVVARLGDAFGGRVSSLEALLDRSRRATDEFSELLKEHGRHEAELQRDLAARSDELIQVQVALAHLRDRTEERERALAELRRRHLGPRTLEPVHLAGRERAELEAVVEQLERRRERIGPVNPLAEQEYREQAERADFLSEQRRDLEASLAELRKVVDDLDRHIEATFTEVFEATRLHFEDMVQVLFPGGRGLLKLVDVRPGDADHEDERDREDEIESEPGEAAPGSQGITLEIKPPKKAPKSLSLLSGGEKALAAIAFLFALFLARPSPFYILDEVEAALDDVNIGRFLSLVRRYERRSQFIIITHQRRTMEIADTLYGVAMDTDGTSRVLSRRLREPDDAQSEDDRGDEVPVSAG